MSTNPIKAMAMKKWLLIWLAIAVQPVAHSQVAYRYWFDASATVFAVDSMSADSGRVQIDMANLNSGFHTLHIQFRDTNGIWDNPKSYLFNVATEYVDSGRLFYYCLDDTTTYTADTIPDDGHKQMDVSQLSSGFHYANLLVGYRLRTHRGITTGTTIPMRFLFNNSDGGVVKYSYWSNGQLSNMQTVNIPHPSDTLHLTEALPVAPMPIRSTNFLFEITDGTPMVYAKNDIRIRFYNDRERFADISAQYVDMCVTDTVNAQLLVRHTKTALLAPTNNQIRWFMMPANAGDTIAVRTDEHCVMQLFSPNGQEVFYCIQDSSTFWIECVASDSGMFYLAVHDVFVSTPRYMSLWYMHPLECHITVVCDSTRGGATVPEHAYWMDTAIITAVPYYGYHFDHWGDGDSSNPRVVFLTGDTTFEALFAPNEYSVSVSVYDTAMGQAHGSGTYLYGDTVTIEAETNPGYLFLYWNDRVEDNPRQFILTQDTQFVVYFCRDIGIDEVDGENICVHPNPANTSVTIEGRDIRWVTVYTTMGRKVLVIKMNGESHCTFGIDELPDGIYILDVATGNGPVRQKLVKSSR